MPCRRYYLLIGLVFCCLFAGVSEVSALAAQRNSTSTANEATTELSVRSGPQQLEQSAKALYGYVLEGNVTKVRQESAEISRIFLTSSFEGLTSVEGINALSAVIIDLKAAVAGVQTSPQRWEAVAAKLRLAANSLNHPRQPLWLQYYKPIREDLNAMEQSASAHDLAGWKSALERLQSRYESIRPAVIISRQPEVVNALDSWLSYAAGVPSSSQKIERARLIEIVSYGQEAVRVMFDKKKDEPVLSLPMASQKYGLWGLLAAGFIVAVLAYSGYRKYRGTNQEWKIV